MQGVALFPQTCMSAVFQEVMAAAKDDGNIKKGYMLLFHTDMFFFLSKDPMWDSPQLCTVQSL